MPFASYKDFDDCVSKNSDKKNAKAYCAAIMRATEGKKEMYSKSVVSMAKERAHATG